MELGRQFIKNLFLLTLLSCSSLILLYFWFSILGLIVGLPSLLLLLFTLLILLSKFFIFPGSFKFWRRWWQSSLEFELCDNFIFQLKNISSSMELLQSLTAPDQLPSTLHESITIFSIILSSYKALSPQSLTKRQRNFLSLMASIQNSLQETILISNNSSETLWTLLLHNKFPNCQNFTFEDFPENINISKVISLLKTLEIFLSSSLKPNTLISLVREGIFTSLDVMRLVLQSSYTCEQYWVSSEGGEVDCILIRNKSESAAPVMIFCGPNGGLYEYANYQNQWLEFYEDLKVDICLWNYRGYGRTKGSSTSSSLKSDAQSIYDFLAKVKLYDKIGVHGESIGAVAATHIARRNPISFLFADRAFSSLSLLVNSRVSFIKPSIFHCLSRWEDHTSKEFLETTCYKLLSCDPTDHIIPEAASLKIAIAIQQVSDVLDPETISEFFEAIQNANGYANKLRNPELEVSQNGIYSAIDRAADSSDDESTSALVFKIFNCLEIDAGGLCLYEISSEKSLYNWIRVLLVWGSFLPLGSNAFGKDKALQKLNSAIEVLARIFKENEFVVNANIVNICRQARLLKNGYIKIVKCFENYYRCNTEEFSHDEEISAHSAGCLLPISSGHNGKFTEDERKLLVYHLKEAEFIK